MVSNMGAPAVQANVRNYFMQFEEAQTQSLIDSKIMEFEMKSRQGLQVYFQHMLIPQLHVYFTTATYQGCHIASAFCKCKVMRCYLTQCNHAARKASSSLMPLSRHSHNLAMLADLTHTNTSKSHVISSSDMFAHMSKLRIQACCCHVRVHPACPQ